MAGIGLAEVSLVADRGLDVLRQAGLTAAGGRVDHPFRAMTPPPVQQILQGRHVAIAAVIRWEETACSVSGIWADLYRPPPDDGRDEARDEGKTKMASDDAIRASDHDRELTAEVLRDAFAVGRIDLKEFHDRAAGAYSAKTWGELRDLTADLPTGQALSHAAADAGPRTGVDRLVHAPRRPFAAIWVMAAIWLAIAGAAHVAAAIPLVLLSLFVLRAARWTVPPDQPHPWEANPGGDRAIQTQPRCATQVIGRIPDDRVGQAGAESPPANCSCGAAAVTRTAPRDLTASAPAGS
jgi:hypothetical protein